MTSESNPSETGSSALSSIEFIFSDHSFSNLGRVVSALLAADGDIIAIEKIRKNTFGMGTIDEKYELSARMTHFISPENESMETAGEHFSTDEPLFTDLLDSLRGTGKRVELIDMGTDDKGYGFYEETQAAHQAAYDAAAAGTEAQADIDNLALDYQIAAARSYEYREHVMERQIQSLVDENPGAKVAVMAGSMHTAMSHRLGGNVDVLRTFVPTEADSVEYGPGVKMHFDPQSAVIRTIRFNLQAMGLSTLE